MRTAGYFTRHVPGYHKGFINLGVYKTPDWSVNDWSESQLYWLPSPNLIDNSHVCKKTANCFHTTKRKNDMDKHEAKCKDIQEIITKQVQYGSTSNEVTKLIFHDFLKISFVVLISRLSTMTMFVCQCRLLLRAHWTVLDTLKRPTTLLKLLIRWLLISWITYLNYNKYCLKCCHPISKMLSSIYKQLKKNFQPNYRQVINQNPNFSRFSTISKITKY